MTLREAEDLYDWMENHSMATTVTLPIDLIPNTSPPQFKWRQTVGTPIGDRTVDHEGTLPPSVEGAVLALIVLAKQQEQEIVGLRRRNEGAYEVIAEQSNRQDRLSKELADLRESDQRAAEPNLVPQQTVAPSVISSKKGRG